MISQTKELGEQLSEGAFDGVSGEIQLWIQHLTAFSLCRGLSALATKQRVVESEDELRALTCEDMNIVREVLRYTEVLKPVSDEILGEVHLLKQLTYDLQRASGETGETVLNGLGGGEEVSGEAADGVACTEQREEAAVVEVTVSPVVEGEGTAREGAVAGTASVALSQCSTAAV